MEYLDFFAVYKRYVMNSQYLRASLHFCPRMLQ